MITVNFSGGLGNNLFQLAMLLNLHSKYGCEYYIVEQANRGNLPSDSSQSKQLEIKYLFDTKLNFKKSHQFNKDFKKYLHIDLSPGHNQSFSEVPFHDNTIYYGTFLSYKYFKDFDFKNSLILNQNIANRLRKKHRKLFDSKTISLHFRLAGDRQSSNMQQYHTDLDCKYYDEAINLILKHSGINSSDVSILVFSDDPELARNRLSELKYKFHVISNDNCVEDFIHMSLCDHNVVGNSTFSWWSAYMNSSEDSVIVAPKSNFVGPKYDYFSLEDLFPKNWITI